jgi:predicted alpha/beta-fold hydrolase
MDPFITAIVILAMVLGYKIISQMISAVKYRGELHNHRNHKKAKVREHVIYNEVDTSDLQARAEEMNKRLATLEEILVSEQRS